MIGAIVIVGIVLNFICFGISVSKEPNGAQGAGAALVLCFVPYLLVGLLIYDRVRG